MEELLFDLMATTEKIVGAADILRECAAANLDFGDTKQRKVAVLIGLLYDQVTALDKEVDALDIKAALLDKEASNG